jgi:hypothetical protein
MWEIVLGAIGFVGVVLGVVWLIGLPGDDDEEDRAGFVTANRDEVERQIKDH